MEIKPTRQRANYKEKLVGTTNKCSVCNSWKKRGVCVTCHFRNSTKEEADLAINNPTAPPKTNVRIGKL